MKPLYMFEFYLGLVEVKAYITEENVNKAKAVLEKELPGILQKANYSKIIEWSDGKGTTIEEKGERILTGRAG